MEDVKFDNTKQVLQHHIKRISTLQALSDKSDSSNKETADKTDLHDDITVNLTAKESRRQRRKMREQKVNKSIRKRNGLTKRWRETKKLKNSD